MSSAPWNHGLPTYIEMGGKEYPIRSDYRAVLDVFLALTDPDLDDYNRLMEVLEIFYVDEVPVELWKEALDKCLWFINGGDDEKGGKGPQLVSWEQDFNLIASPISRVIGQDIRGMEYLHWWSFLSAYMAIGDCLFAQIVAIRDKKARGKPLEKYEREFYRRNRELIEIKKHLTDAEAKFVHEWM